MKNVILFFFTAEHEGKYIFKRTLKYEKYLALLCQGSKNILKYKRVKNIIHDKVQALFIVYHTIRSFFKYFLFVFFHDLLCYRNICNLIIKDYSFTFKIIGAKLQLT